MPMAEPRLLTPKVLVVAVSLFKEMQQWVPGAAS